MSIAFEAARSGGALWRKHGDQFARSRQVMRGAADAIAVGGAAVLDTLVVASRNMTTVGLYQQRSAAAGQTLDRRA
jgi:hypothetical protein